MTRNSFAFGAVALVLLLSCRGGNDDLFAEEPVDGAGAGGGGGGPGEGGGAAGEGLRSGECGAVLDPSATPHVFEGETPAGEDCRSETPEVELAGCRVTENWFQRPDEPVEWELITTIERTYDELGTLLSERTDIDLDGAWDRTTVNELDEQGRLVRSTFDANPNNANLEVTTFEWEGYRLVREARDSEGDGAVDFDYSYAYDERGCRRRSVLRNSYTAYEYDERGNLETIVRYSCPEALEESRVVQSWELQAGEWLVTARETYAEGEERPSRRVLYDNEQGRPRRVEDYEGDVLITTKELQWDALGRPLVSTLRTSRADNSTREERWQYDCGP